MRTCTLCRKVQIVPGTYADYKQLAQYHYRDNGPGQFTRIYALRARSGISNLKSQIACIGVIVYSTASLGQELRNIATDNFFIGYDRNTQLSLLNKYVRRISRVIIEPRFRSLGLATKLVRETMPLMNVPIIEASAVMGNINPFLEKAGMTAYHGPEKMFIDPASVQRRIESLDDAQAEFIENEIRRFLTSYGELRYSWPTLKRMTFVLNKLTTRPVYYIWFNPFIKTHQ